MNPPNPVLVLMVTQSPHLRVTNTLQTQRDPSAPGSMCVT